MVSTFLAAQLDALPHRDPKAQLNALPPRDPKAQLDALPPRDPKAQLDALPPRDPKAQLDALPPGALQNRARLWSKPGAGLSASSWVSTSARLSQWLLGTFEAEFDFETWAATRQCGGHECYEIVGSNGAVDYYHEVLVEGTEMDGAGRKKTSRTMTWVSPMWVRSLPPFAMLFGGYMRLRVTVRHAG